MHKKAKKNSLPIGKRVLLVRACGLPGVQMTDGLDANHPLHDGYLEGYFTNLRALFPGEYAT